MEKIENKNLFGIPFKTGFLTFEAVLGVVLLIDSGRRIIRFIKKDG
jgi:hypothetical protein